LILRENTDADQKLVLPDRQDGACRQIKWWLAGPRGCKSRSCRAGVDVARTTQKPIVHTNDESDKSPAMSGFKEPSFADRQKAAQQAKQNILDKFRAQPGPDDPQVAQKRAEREAAAATRTKAREAREAEKTEQKRRDAEAAEQAAAQLAHEKAEETARQAAVEAEQKAKRDARYAARKTKGKKK
jgi:uncharacterized protein YdaU (DUF1376 family)